MGVMAVDALMVMEVRVDGSGEDAECERGAVFVLATISKG